MQGLVKPYITRREENLIANLSVTVETEVFISQNEKRTTNKA